VQASAFACLRLIDAADREVHMIIRVFRARTKPGHTPDELARFAKEITIPFGETKPGLAARYTGRGVGETGKELTMITLWEDLDALKK
jgi:hypothetical protein